MKKSDDKKNFIFYLYIAAAVVGLILLVHVIWLQVYSPSAQAEKVSNFVPFTATGSAIIFGVAIGIVFINSIRNRSQRNEGKNDFRKVVKPRELRNMMIGYIVCEVICLLLAYFSTVVSYFLVAIGGTALCICSIIYFLVWYYISERKEKKESGQAA